MGGNVAGFGDVDGDSDVVEGRHGEVDAVAEDVESGADRDGGAAAEENGHVGGRVDDRPAQALSHRYRRQRHRRRAEAVGQMDSDLVPGPQRGQHGPETLYLSKRSGEQRCQTGITGCGGVRRWGLPGRHPSSAVDGAGRHGSLRRGRARVRIGGSPRCAAGPRWRVGG